MASAAQFPSVSASSGDGATRTVERQQSSGREDNSSTAACGYVTFVLCNVLLVVYPLWALLPKDVIASIEEHCTIYYLPRGIALYPPTYLALVFVVAPALYVGLNMRSSPAADDADGVWDSRSHECRDEGNEKCDSHHSASAFEPGESIPAICDEDVRSVNLRARQRLGKETRDR